MTVTSSWNRRRYSLYAPVYDQLARPFRAGRRRAIERLDLEADDHVLLLGCGTGLDLEFIPPAVEVTAVDVVPGMVDRTAARARAQGRDASVSVADGADLPFEAEAFDAVCLHLVLSVVPDPAGVAEETARVIRPDGRVSIYDKFVPAGETPSLTRRVLEPVASRLFASLTRSLEPMLAGTDLGVGETESFLARRYIVTVARHESEHNRSDIDPHG
jgi:phosphatidylethanolamine/phosphatidyl-N-methylethanolamine N-methyltransferase